MVYLGLTLICVAFIELFILFALSDSVKATFDLSRQSLAIVGSKTLSDEQKEIQIRRASLQMFKTTFWFIGKFLLLIALLYLLHRVLLALLPYSEAEFQRGLVSLTAIAALTVFAVAYIKLRHVLIQRLRSS